MYHDSVTITYYQWWKQMQFRVRATTSKEFNVFWVCTVHVGLDPLPLFSVCRIDNRNGDKPTVCYDKRTDGCVSGLQSISGSNV